MSIIEATPDLCASSVIDTVPLVMRYIRSQVRNQGIGSLSIPQLRVLYYLSTNPGGSLSEVAEHIGVTKATASVLMERLVRRELVNRADNPDERRRMVLTLTPEGERICGIAREKAQMSISAVLCDMPVAELHIMEQGLALLKQAFVQMQQVNNQQINGRLGDNLIEQGATTKAGRQNSHG